MDKKLFVVTGLALLIFVSSVSAQTKQADKNNQPKRDTTPKAAAKAENNNNIVMLEDILIQVSPELPTVVVTIPRQKPEIEPVSIQSPIERMVSQENEVIKPDLTKMKVSKVEEPDKMLAQPRIR